MQFPVAIKNKVRCLGKSSKRRGLNASFVMGNPMHLWIGNRHTSGLKHQNLGRIYVEKN